MCGFSVNLYFNFVFHFSAFVSSTSHFWLLFMAPFHCFSLHFSSLPASFNKQLLFHSFYIILLSTSLLSLLSYVLITPRQNEVCSLIINQKQKLRRRKTGKAVFVDVCFWHDFDTDGEKKMKGHTHVTRVMVRAGF